MLTFSNNRIDIKLSPPKETDSSKKLCLGFCYRTVDWHVSSRAHIFNQLSFLPSIVEQLDIQVPYHLVSISQVDMGDMQWLELFRLFTAVRTLRLHHALQSFIVLVLQELSGERATEVFPALGSLYLRECFPLGYDEQTIESFVDARQHSGHPVAVHYW